MSKFATEADEMEIRSAEESAPGNEALGALEEMVSTINKALAASNLKPSDVEIGPDEFENEN